MLDSFQSGEVQLGHSVELPCVASGYPNPTIRWLKDGRPLPSDSRWTRRITGLTISDLRLEDSGNYVCEVTNSFGSKEVAGHLNVIGRLRMTRHISDSRERMEQRRSLLFKFGVTNLFRCVDLLHFY